VQRSFQLRHFWPWVSLALFLGACAVVTSGDKGSQEQSARESTDPYAKLPAPMTVTECGRCHVRHFSDLRQAGGAHRFACQDCHQAFHAYNPRRDNYDELMPDCGQCHAPLPHGNDIHMCLDCHQNPHAPLLLPSAQVLGDFCRQCHQQVDGALRQEPSAHSEVACIDCHSQQHGQSPACAECHQPHLPKQQESACRQCHPVHQPLLVNPAGDESFATCAACHAEVFDLWTATSSRHGEVSCSDCHIEHRHLPACADCHGTPHSEEMLSKFPDCLTCHGDVHDMPVKR
jgi:hypothetical protein